MWDKLLPPLNELFMITSALCVAAGWLAIRRGRQQVHKALMLTGSALGAAFFVSYVVKTLAVGDTTFGGPARWRLPYQVFLESHATLATVAGILGVITLRRALAGRFSLHRRIAPWTATLWFVAAGTGLAVYLLLYVVYAPGPTTNVLRAILGR